MNQPHPALESLFPPGPYNRRGYYIPLTNTIRPTDAIVQGLYTARGPYHQPPAASITCINAPLNKPAGTTQLHNLSTTGRPPVLGSLEVHPNSDFVVVYLSIGGPPLFFQKQDSDKQEPGRIGRAQLSVAWHRPSVRAVLWSHSETRRQLLVSLFKPPEPMTVEEANKVTLNDMRLPLRLELTQEEFWKGLRLLYPSEEGSAYHISEWAMTCPRCGKEVVGYATDTLWSERFLNHRLNSCRIMSDGRHR